MKWIPCGEKLPQTFYEESEEGYGYWLSKPVLVSRIGNDFLEEDRIVVAYCVIDMGKIFWNAIDANPIKGVVAWMPLPEPYKGEKYEID